MDFDLRQLEIFCKVVERQSFSQAAQALHLAQASVSERIATLENLLGTRLLDRLGRRVVPTRAGEILYQRALQLLEMKRETCQELDFFLGLRRGTISIGASTIPGEYILPRLIKQYRSIYPEVSIQVKIGDTDEIAGLVSEGIMEFGIVGSRGKRKNLNYQELWKDELVLIIPGSHPWSGRKSVRISEILTEPVILRESGSGTLKILEDNLRERSGIDPSRLNVIATLGSSSAVKEGVKAGLGISIISSRAAESEVKTGTLKILRIKDLPLLRSFYLIHDRRRALSPLGKSLADFLREND